MGNCAGGNSRGTVDVELQSLNDQQKLKIEKLEQTAKDLEKEKDLLNERFSKRIQELESQAEHQKQEQVEPQAESQLEMEQKALLEKYNVRIKQLEQRASDVQNEKNVLNEKFSKRIKELEDIAREKEQKRPETFKIDIKKPTYGDFYCQLHLPPQEDDEEEGDDGEEEDDAGEDDELSPTFKPLKDNRSAFVKFFVYLFGLFNDEQSDDW